MLKLGQRAAAIDDAARRVVLENGDVIAFDALILATGADPVRLSIPGSDLPHVAYIWTLADRRTIGRDRASLEAEAAMARNDIAALEAIVSG